jgi:hypothetical protein
LQQVGTGPDIGRRASKSPAPHPALETTLASLGASDPAKSTGSRTVACAQVKRITRIYGNVASATTAQVVDIHSKIVALGNGAVPPACWPPSGQIGGSARAVEVRDMVAHAAELEALDGPFRHRAPAAASCMRPERGGSRA